MSIANEIPFHDWNGSPFEIGRQHGQTLREQIVNENGPAAHMLANDFNLSLQATLNRIVEIYLPLYSKHLPIAIEEIRGIASGADLSYPFAFFAAIRDGLNVYPHFNTEQCTSFVCGSNTTRDGNILMGQTKDTGLSTERYHLMRFEYESGKRLFVLNYPGWVANVTLTSDGMALTSNALYAETPVGETVPYSFLKRAAMEKSSLNEFLMTIEGLSFGNGCFSVGDAKGHAVCIESVAGQSKIRDISKQAFGHANSIVSEELKCYEDPRTHLPSSPLRQQNVQRMLNEISGRITINELKCLTADHTDYPFSICRHPVEIEPLGTSAAIIMDLTNLEVHVALGNPCRSTFEKYKL